jgi:hypothetical protein
MFASNLPILLTTGPNDLSALMMIRADEASLFCEFAQRFAASE